MLPALSEGVAEAFWAMGVEPETGCGGGAANMPVLQVLKGTSATRFSSPIHQSQ